jgi:hypothetical protein|tara:strand:- start:981 stop:1403 length:423 start_codon:yes stop_codon:yes gene_type:complete
MRIYLSQSEPEDGSLEHFTNVATFSRDVMDSEATNIVCDRFLSSFPYSQGEAVLGLVMQKMRIGCELIIMEPDFYLISKHIFQDNIDEKLMNEIIFKSGNLKSILTMETIAKWVCPKLEIVSKHFDEKFCTAIITTRRSE